MVSRKSNGRYNRVPGNEDEPTLHYRNGAESPTTGKLHTSLLIIIIYSLQMMMMMRGHYLCKVVIMTKC